MPNWGIEVVPDAPSNNEAHTVLAHRMLGRVACLTGSASILFTSWETLTPESKRMLKAIVERSSAYLDEALKVVIAGGPEAALVIDDADGAA